MSKYQDNQRIDLFGDRVLIIDGVSIQCIILDQGCDYEPYTYYNYHIENTKTGEVLQQDCSVPVSVIDDIVTRNQDVLYDKITLREATLLGNFFFIFLQNSELIPQIPYFRQKILLSLIKNYIINNKFNLS